MHCSIGHHRLRCTESVSFVHGLRLNPKDAMLPGCRLTPVNHTTRPILLFLVARHIRGIGGNRRRFSRTITTTWRTRFKANSEAKPHHGNDWASYIELKLKGATAQEHGGTVKGFFTRRPKKPNEFKTLQGKLIQIPIRERGESTTHYFVSFPPMPAILLMPFVAAVGYGANDVLFTIIFGALNGVLFYALLIALRKAGHSLRTSSDNHWLVVCLAFGSAHLWCSVLGQVWFTALIVGVTFHIAYIYFAFDLRRPFLAGLCLAAAFATRAPLVFGAIFFTGTCSLDLAEPAQRRKRGVHL